MSFNWAVLGASAKVREIFGKITATGRHKAVTVFSDEPKDSVIFAATFQAKVVGSVKEAIEEDGVNGVFIALPVTYRYSATMEVLNAGKPVLVMPSATVNDSQLKKAMNVALERNVYYGVADVGRYYNIVNEAKNLVFADALGQIYDMRGSIYERPQKASGRHDSRTGSGSILIAAPYMLSMANMFLGYPNTVKCHDQRAHNGMDITDRIEMNYDVATCHITSSIRIRRFNQLKLYGRFGTLTLRFHRNGCTSLIKIRRCPIRRRVEQNGYVTMFDKVAGDIRNGEVMSEELKWAAMVDIARMEDACRQKIGLNYSASAESTLPVATPTVQQYRRRKHRA